MFPTNPQIEDGASFFIWAVVILLAFVSAVSIVDFRNAKKDK